MTRWTLHDDWHWIVNHAWSTRFIAIAFLLSGAEVALPFVADKAPIQPELFAGVIGLVTGAAFVARLVAQKHEIPSEEQIREEAARALIAQAKAGDAE